MTPEEKKEFAQNIAAHIIVEDMTITRAASIKKYYLSEMSKEAAREMLPLIDEALREKLHPELF